MDSNFKLVWRQAQSQNFFLRKYLFLLSLLLAVGGFVLTATEHGESVWGAIVLIISGVLGATILGLYAGSCKEDICEVMHLLGLDYSSDSVSLATLRGFVCEKLEELGAALRKHEQELGSRHYGTNSSRAKFKNAYALFVKFGLIEDVGQARFIPQGSKSAT